jgi:hypothetical protein
VVIRVLVVGRGRCVVLQRGPRDLRPKLPFVDEIGWRPSLGDQFLAEIVLTSTDPERRARLVRRLGGTRPRR